MLPLFLKHGGEGEQQQKPAELYLKQYSRRTDSRVKIIPVSTFQSCIALLCNKIYLQSAVQQSSDQLTDSSKGIMLHLL